jgi:TolB-like protein/Tfp pilus assembly protein PilF
MSDKVSFLSELKRRNVYKVAVAYIVVSWLLIQAASILFPTFDAPPWAMKALVALLVLCFPVALVLSWAFEITPEGIKLESEIDPKKSITRKTGRKIVGLTIAVAIVAAGLLVFQMVGRRDRWARRSGEGNSEDGRPSSPSVPTPTKSIAVLPFDNLSRDPDNAYFCEGVQDEILTRLAKVADLKVISRTSTQHFKSTPDNLPEIARQLGVAHIVEGSVQKFNDQVRVNVQLIKAQSDAHLWADTYDRKLTDIFAVESEIAKAIAETLQAKLSGAEKSSIAKAPTANPEAYELYLKGRFFWNKRTGDDLRKSIEYLKQAIGKDPNYALAYAALADSYGLLRFYGGASPAESIVLAEAAAKKALELDDSLAEAHASLGLIATEELDLNRAVKEQERAIELNPNYATAHHWLGLGFATLREPDRSIAELKRALELDPLSMIINADLSIIYLYAGRYDAAEAQARKTLEIDSRSFVAHYYLGAALQLTSRLKEAIPEFQKAVELNNDPYSIAMLAQAYARNGQTDEARKLLAHLNAMAKSAEVPEYALALVYTSLGERERAIEALEHGFSEGNKSYLFLLPGDPFLDDLRGDPRFEALVQKITRAK